MKKTDLEKLRGLKINEKLAKSTVPDRFGKASTGLDADGQPVQPKGLMGALLRKGIKS
ncbi:hypothetical protein [Chitinimonas arctica]|uniref:hypothetical protein n=1 Tax=Chitinimonas arctica TaxID=2594795 RepID=UPI0015D275B6|nr:hypothetical protein [Chitinimonas arctica]